MTLFDGDKFRLRNSSGSEKKIKRARGQLLEDVVHDPGLDLVHDTPEIDPDQHFDYGWPVDVPGIRGIRVGMLWYPEHDPNTEFAVSKEIRWGEQDGLLIQGEAVLNPDGTMTLTVEVTFDGGNSSTVMTA